MAGPVGAGRSGAGKMPPVAMASARMASLEWPPPPSPSTGSPIPPSCGAAAYAASLHPASLGAAGQASGFLGATSGMNILEEEYRRKVPSEAAAYNRIMEGSHRASEIRARTKLWDLRAEVERESLRAVAPFPFFGKSMRFQDEFSALQITDDSRFSYSTCIPAGGWNETPAAQNDAGEQVSADIAPSNREVKVRNVTTYEGVLVTPLDPDDPAFLAGPAKTAMPGTDTGTKSEDRSGNGPDAAGPQRGDPEVACIEGRAMVKHLVKERDGHGAVLTSVEPGTFRFAITVNPFFNPQGATIQSLSKETGRQPPRKRQLPYVGPGSKGETSSGLSASLSTSNMHGSGSPGLGAWHGSTGPLTDLKGAFEDWRRSQIISASRDFQGAASAAAQLKRDRDQRQRQPRLRFSQSMTGASKGRGLDLTADASLANAATEERAARRRQSLLAASASAPNLRNEEPKAKAGQPQPTVAEWREFYRQRAAELLRAAEE